MVTFNGTQKKATAISKCTYYDVAWNSYFHLCSGRCNLVLQGYDNAYYECRRTLAWGYDGASPDLLSVGLLSCALLEHNSEEEISIGNFNRIVKFKFGPWRAIVLRNYRKFTRQVASKLPPDWDMTTDEIRAWIEDHNNLPACIKKNNKPNQKDRGILRTLKRKHGKEKGRQT